jgi:hypothetical protein
MIKTLNLMVPRFIHLYLLSGLSLVTKGWLQLSMLCLFGVVCNHFKILAHYTQ